MLQDTPELRQLVFVAEQRRVRFCRMPVASVAMEMNDDLRAEEMDDRLHEAKIAMMTAQAALLDYLLTAMDMRSELRS